MIDEKIYYVLQNEIQFVANFELVLNSLQHVGNIGNYVTGSYAKLLSKDFITEFHGEVIRGIYILYHLKKLWMIEVS